MRYKILFNFREYHIPQGIHLIFEFTENNFVIILLYFQYMLLLNSAPHPDSCLSKKNFQVNLRIELSMAV